MLSARGEEYDKIHGFELGIDDYVVKPFSPKELMMRINAIMKRAKPAADQPKKDQVSFEGLTIDFTGRIVTIDGEKCRSFAKGIRPVVLLCKEPQHRIDKGKFDYKCLGL